MHDSGPHHRLSCVLPAYNEAENLPQTVSAWAAALPRHTRDHEIIVVDDGSVDQTASVLRDLSARYERVRVIRHETNLGYGAAIANGFAQAAFPLLFFTDADGQYEPEDVRLLLERIDAADMVVGYRVRRADTAFRRLLSGGYNLLTRRLVGISLRDINCAFKLMHQDTFRGLGIALTGFGVNAELALRARRAQMAVVEVPIRHRPRQAGRSTVRPIHVLRGLQELARLRHRHVRASQGIGIRAAARSALPLEQRVTSKRPAR
jgi:glycosyltransferase involved in cell wall biosynthesis